jgi:Flp pilus assembly pilin Flp
MKNLILKLQVWKDKRGQDLIEYALMAGFVAVAAGAIMPGVASSISVIFSKISPSFVPLFSSKPRPFITPSQRTE